LTNLDLYLCDNVTNEGIKHLTNLTNLNIGNCKNITDEGMKGLINLTELRLNMNITNT